MEVDAGQNIAACDEIAFLLIDDGVQHWHIGLNCQVMLYILKQILVQKPRMPVCLAVILFKTGIKLV